MRRTWVKLYVDQILRGSMFTELLPDERFTWFGFIVLAGDSPIDGKICLTENMGYSDEQIADLLKVETELIKRAKRKFVKFGKVVLFDNNVIGICNWKIYQSEYDRQKGYRKKLQDGVTNCSPSLSPSSSLSSSKIDFDFILGAFTGITPEIKAGWSKTYPAVDIEGFILHMAAWMKANPDKRKSNYERSWVNWLKKEQDKGGYRQGNRPQKPSYNTTWLAKKLKEQESKNEPNPD